MIQRDETDAQVNNFKARKTKVRLKSKKNKQRQGSEINPLNNAL